MSSQSLLFLTYLNNIFDHINDAILLIGIEGDEYRVLMVNERFAEVSHGVYSTKDQGKLVREVVPPQAYKELSAQYACVAANNAITEYVSNDVATGDTYTYRTKFIPILNAFEVCTHLVAIISDITVAKAQKAEIAELKAELKKLRKPANKFS